MMPIVPYLTDVYESVDNLFFSAKDINTHYILPGVLYLRGPTRKSFFSFIAKEYPFYYTILKELYKKCGLDKNYKDRLYVMINFLLKKYGLSTSFSKVISEKMSLSEEESKQLSLF